MPHSVGTEPCYFFFGAGVDTLRCSTVVVLGCDFAYPGVTICPVRASRGITIVFVAMTRAFLAICRQEKYRGFNWRIPWQDIRVIRGICEGAPSPPRYEMGRKKPGGKPGFFGWVRITLANTISGAQRSNKH